MNSILFKIFLIFLINLTTVVGQKKVGNAFRDKLKLISEHNNGQHNAVKWAVIRYNFEPLNTQAKPATYFNFQETPYRHKFYNLKLVKGDKVLLIRIKEGYFGGKYGNWVQIELPYGTLPANCTLDHFIVVPLGSLDIKPYQYCVLTKADKPFKIGDTLMIEPIKSYRDGKAYPFYAIRNNKRLNLVWYDINFELTDFKEIEVSKAKRAYFESRKAWVEPKDEYFSIYLGKKKGIKEIMNLVIKSSLFPVIILIIILILYLLLRKRNKQMNIQQINNPPKQDISGKSAIFGFFTLLITISYWFNEDTKYSLINIATEPFGFDDFKPNPIFLIHFFILIISTLSLIVSGLPDLIGYRLSLLPYISNQFYSGKLSAKDKRQYLIIFLVLLLGAIFVFLYFFPSLNYLKLSSSERPSSFWLMLSLILWFCIYVVNAIYVEPLEVNTTGIYDYTEQNAWLKIGDNLVAYIKSVNDTDFKFISSGEKIDVSLSKVYTIEKSAALFRVTIPNEIITKDGNGSLSYFFDLQLDFKDFPLKLKSEKLNYIIHQLNNPNEIKKEIFFSNEKKENINDIKNEMIGKVNELKIRTQNNIPSDDELKQIQTYLLESQKTLQNIQKEITQNIKNRIESNSGLVSMIGIDFKFLNNGNDLLEIIKEKVKEIDALIEKIFGKLFDSFIKSKEEAIRALTLAAQNPALSQNQINNISKIIFEIEAMNPVPNNFKMLGGMQTKLNQYNNSLLNVPQNSSVNNVTTQILSNNQTTTLEKAIKEIATELRVLIAGKADIQTIRKELSNSTTYFRENKLSINTFFQKLENEIPALHTKKSQAFYEEIVGKILSELS